MIDLIILIGVFSFGYAFGRQITIIKRKQAVEKIFKDIQKKYEVAD